MENQEFDKLFQAKLGGAQPLPFDPAAWDAVAPAVSAFNSGGGGWSSGALAALLSAVVIAALIPWYVVSPPVELTTSGAFAEQATSSAGIVESAANYSASNANSASLASTAFVNPNADKADPSQGNATTVLTDDKTGNSALVPHPVSNEASAIAVSTNSSTSARKAVKASAEPNTDRDDELYHRMNRGLVASTSEMLPPVGNEEDANAIAFHGLASGVPDFALAMREKSKVETIKNRFKPSSFEFIGGPLWSHGLVNSGDPNRGSNGFGGFAGIGASWWLSNSFSFNANVVTNVRSGLNSEKLFRSEPDDNDNRFDSATVRTSLLTSVDVPLYFKYSFGWTPELAFRNSVLFGMEYSIPVFSATETVEGSKKSTDWLGSPTGFNHSLALTLGYEYACNERIRLGIRGTLGLFDMTDDSHFGYSVVDRNNQLRLTVGYQLGKLAAH